MSLSFSELYQFFLDNLFWAILALSLLALVCGMILGYAAKRFFVEGDPIVENIDAILPQSQCAQCGYPGCKPYAEAVGLNREAINKCAPGGEPVMLKIAELLGVDPQPIENEENATPIKKVAFIDEANCIGCVKCIQVCPVDAIIGATRAMHTVIADACTGCDLCVDPCPTNCITMIPVAEQNQYRFKQLSAIPVAEQNQYRFKQLSAIPVAEIPVTTVFATNSELQTVAASDKRGI